MTRCLGVDDLGEKAPGVRERRGSVGYEPPRGKRVLTPAEVEREVLYAGEPSVDL